MNDLPTNEPHQILRGQSDKGKWWGCGCFEKNGKFYHVIDCEAPDEFHTGCTALERANLFEEPRPERPSPPLRTT